MNRDIKFRAWDGEQMIILENSGLQYFDFEGSYSLGFTVDAYSGFWSHEQYENPTEKAKEFPIMQYTGLKDKNGVEIYEGDTLRAIKREQYDEKGAYAFTINDNVTWDTGGFKVFSKPLPDFYIKDGRLHECRWYSRGLNYEIDTYWIMENFEIIGNIHEHPHLLNQNTQS